MVQPLREIVLRFLKKLKIELPYDPAVPLLGIIQKDTCTLFFFDTCTLMFTVSLSTIGMTWKPPKCPLMDEWIKKRWYIYTQWTTVQP